MSTTNIQSQSSTSKRPLNEQIQAKFDLSIALALSTWQALTLAVQEKWGGADSSEKRDWFAGAISDLFENSTEAIDGEYLEEFMLQVMNDEFDVNIEDGSGEHIAELIVKLRKQTSTGDFTKVDEMYSLWEDKQQRGEKEKIKFVQAEDQDSDTDSDSNEDEEDEDSMDVDVPARHPREKPIPEVDDDGFTKVVGRRGR